jgi:hypothetical protein
VAVFKALMRFLSYLFHGLFALFLLAMSSLALASGQVLHLDMLPWSGSTLTYAIFFGALFGLLCLVLALKGALRPLFFIWALAVAVLLIKGYIFSGYRFAAGEFGRALYLIGGSLIALPGAWFQMFRRSVRAKRTL